MDIVDSARVKGGNIIAESTVCESQSRVIRPDSVRCRASEKNGAPKDGVEVSSASSPLGLWGCVMIGKEGLSSVRTFI